MTVEYLNPPGLAEGPHSHVAVVTGGRTIYVAGQVAADLDWQVVGPDFEGQVRQVFENLRIALEAAGAGLSDVVKMNIYICGLNAEKLAAFRQVRGTFMGTHRPASTLVDTRALIDPNFEIEIEVVAVVE